MAISLLVKPDLDPRAIRSTSSEIHRDLERAGRDAGDDWSKAFSRGVESGSPKVDQAMQRMSKSFDKVSDASGRVRVEQERYDAVIRSGETDRVKLVASSEKLAKARRVEESATRDAARAERDLVRIHNESARATLDLGDSAGSASGNLRTLGATLGALARVAAPVAIVGLGAALVEVVGVAASASKSLLLLPAAAAAAATGFGTLKLATLGFSDALESMRDPEKFATALQSLSPNAQQAALSIQALLPQFDRLKSATQDALFAGVGEQLWTLANTLLPTVERTTTGVARAFNRMFDALADQLMTPEMQESLSAFADNTIAAFQNLVPAVAPLTQAFADLVAVGSDFLPDLAKGAADAAEAFGDFITNARESGKLHEWLSEGLTTVKQLAEIGWDVGRAFMKFAEIGERDLPKVVSAVDSLANSMDKIITALEAIGRLVQTVFDPLRGVAGLANLFGFGGGTVEGTAVGPGGQPARGTVPRSSRPSGAAGAADFGAQLGGGGGTYPGPFGVPAAPPKPGDTPSTTERRNKIRDEILGGNPNFGAPAIGQTTQPTPMPGAAPQITYGTGGAYGQPGYGYFDVDQRQILRAQHTLLSEQRDFQEAQIQLEVLRRDSLATQKERQDAEWRVVEGGWQLDEAQHALAEAQQGTWKKLNDQTSALTSGMDQIGAALDADFGISKGLPGLAENLTKFLANLALAPTLGRLSLTSALNPNQGSGLIGSLASQGVFGSRFMPQTQPGGYASVAGQAGVYPQPVAAPGGQPYGLAPGTNTGGYGSSGPAFPSWVHSIENAFGIKASTYAGHQESDRNEAGYAPNPQHLNRGIDWTGTTDAMQRFVDYLKTIPGQLEQVIFQNPATGQATEIAGGRSQPGYFAGDLGGHRDHVHTRQSSALLTPGAMPGADWQTMAQKEASGNWQANTGNGYYGGLQFLPSSWAQAGGLQYAPRADLATPQQQIAAGESLLAQQGPGAWPNTFTPYGGGIGTGAVGPGLAGPPQARVGGLAPAAGPPGGGNLGFGGGLIDLASAAGGIGLDAMAPGAGAAAQIGTQLAKRAIAFGGQVAGIGVGGLLETFLPHGSPLADPNRSWFGKFAAGLAGARTALPNIAGSQPAPAAPAAASGAVGPDGQPLQQGGAAPGAGITVNYTNNQATEDRAGADLTRHLTAIAGGPGR